jgi:hypothetical protein
MDGFIGGSNACAGLSEKDRETLRQAAETLVDARGIILMITEVLGNAIASAGGSLADLINDKFGIDLKAKAGEVAEVALWRAQTGATLAMDSESASERWQWFHKLVATASGAGAGLVGAPGLPWDLPVTIGLIMRSVADIARSYPGENLNSVDTKRACIAVFAFGGPQADDDEAELGYFATRLSLEHVTIEVFIKRVAAQFGATLSEKILTQAVPITGAVLGASLNYAFIDYYQQMARVHFTIREVERRSPDPSAVRACFTYAVHEARRKRNSNSKDRYSRP